MLVAVKVATGDSNLKEPDIFSALNVASRNKPSISKDQDNFLPPIVVKH